MSGPNIDGKTPAQQVGAMTEFVLHELALARASTAVMQRGRVLPLTAQERVTRMLWLAGLADLAELDDGVNKAGGPTKCPDMFYLLKEHNGGKDPRASDPADRWSKPGEAFVNRTCDCIGGMAWAGGWDRYQPIRFAHIYDGWINTDSMRMDAAGPMRCFIKLAAPEPGCYVVCASGSPGHAVGHIGGVVSVPDNFDRTNRDHWHAIKVVDVAARTPNKANAMSTALGWFGTDAWFIRSVMR